MTAQNVFYVLTSKDTPSRTIVITFYRIQVPHSHIEMIWIEPVFCILKNYQLEITILYNYNTSTAVSTKNG